MRIMLIIANYSGVVDKCSVEDLSKLDESKHDEERHLSLNKRVLRQYCYRVYVAVLIARDTLNCIRNVRSTDTVLTCGLL